MTASADGAMPPRTKAEERRAVGVACGAHALHDGYTDLIYVMLPIWQSEFGLGFAALGLMKTVFSGTLAGFQIPSGLLAERFGAPIVLALGTALAGFGYCLAGFSSGVAALVAALFVAGLGASTQHPLASSLIAHAFAGARSLKALGTYNFAGDIGKMTLPAAASLLFVVLPWREALVLLGGLGALAAIAIFVLIPRFAAEAAAPRKSEASAGAGSRLSQFGFPLLLSVGVIDSATRMAFLTFLPFVLTAKGASLPTVGLALTLVFAGGAAGKLVCAFIGARIGAVATVWLTEAVTALGIVALLPLSLEAALVLLPVVGDRAQRHLVGALRLGAGPGGAGAAPARLRHFLYRDHRRGRGVAGDLWLARRRGRRAVGADGGGGGRAADAADHAGAAAGAAQPKVNAPAS